MLAWQRQARQSGARALILAGVTQLITISAPLRWHAAAY
jgi:hypothetical protein